MYRDFFVAANLGLEGSQTEIMHNELLLARRCMPYGTVKPTGIEQGR